MRTFNLSILFLLCLLISIELSEAGEEKQVELNIEKEVEVFIEKFSEDTQKIVKPELKNVMLKLYQKANELLWAGKPHEAYPIFQEAQKILKTRYGFVRLALAEISVNGDEVARRTYKEGIQFVNQHYHRIYDGLMHMGMADIEFAQENWQKAQDLYWVTKTILDDCPYELGHIEFRLGIINKKINGDKIAADMP